MKRYTTQPFKCRECQNPCRRSISIHIQRMKKCQPAEPKSSSTPKSDLTHLRSRVERG